MIHHGARTQARSSTGAIRFPYFLLEWNYGLRVNRRCKTFLERVLLARCRNARTDSVHRDIPFRTQLGNFLKKQISSKKYVATSVLLLSSCDKSKEKIEHASMEYYASHVTVTRKRHRTTIASMTVRTKEKYEKYAARRSLVALLAHNLDSYSPCLWRRQNGFCKAIGSRIMQRGCVATLTTQLESCTKRHLTFERHPPIFPGETCLQISDNIS